MKDHENENVTSIFDAMVDGVYVIDENYNLEYMNDVMIKTFHEGIGLKCHQVIHQRPSVCPWCRGKEVFAGKTVRWEYHIQRMGKTYDLVEFPLRNAGDRISKVGIFRDITREKKARRGVKGLRRGLQTAV